NDRVYVGTHEKADDIGDIHCKMQFSPGVMIWLGV
ncbi:unnamed protein product, partial [Rotaria sordida]